MAVPEHIRKVPRPVNTVVCDNGGAGPHRYCVRERNGFLRQKDGSSAPRNGRVIGHIIDNRFVPLNEGLKRKAQYLSYGSAALVNSEVDDIKSDLLSIFSPSDAFDILVMAMLRVLRPRITAKRYSSEFECSYLSVWYPTAHLSKNKISDLQIKLGMNKDKREEFNYLRLQRVCKEHHIAIDGTLKQDNSRINNLSAFSHKARVKGIKEISILYAFDTELLEPVCAEVFQGNSIDATSYSAFIRDNKITRGIILTDKGFPVSAAKEEFAKHRDLHYLSPIKRNDTRITKNGMFEFDEQLYGVDAEVVCKKVRLEDGTFLYSFRDNRRHAMESRTFLTNSRKHQSFNSEDYLYKQERFGLIVFESDLDMSCRDVFKCHSNRWLLELMFSQFKGYEGLTTTNVQSDYAVQGSEFINFIATIITSRITRRMEEAGLMLHDSYGDIMTDLARVRRNAAAPQDGLPLSSDTYWDQNPLKGIMEGMEKLGLCRKLPEVKTPSSKPGRAQKPKEEKQPEPKRPRGRPRIHPKPDTDVPRRGRGRPRKEATPETTEKRPRGRPRIHPKPDPNAPKRPRGRPRKNPLPNSDGSD